MDIDYLLDPAEAYNSTLKEKMHNNTAALFDSLLKQSGVDAEENKKLAGLYERLAKDRDEAKSKLSTAKIFRVVTIILTIISIALLVYGIYYNKIEFIIAPALVAVSGVLVWLLSLNKLVKARKEVFDKLDLQANEALSKAYKSIEPLLALFEGSMTRDLVLDTFPELKIDKNYNMRRYDYLSSRYGYPDESGRESSTVDIMSGEICGNPYVFEKTLNHVMGTQTYKGSLTIHWTSSEYINGKLVTRHHSQTLHASVTKPKPFYHLFSNLVYGNDAAPELTFSRKKTHIESMSEKKQESYARSQAKKIKKYAKEHLESGFTELGNEEFDGIFYAIDRNDEVHFRQLFNPLAQQNLLKLMKGGSPYGDDFNFVKSHCLNYITSDHGQSMTYTVNPSVYNIYSVERCRAIFEEVNEGYFKSIFFDFAPLLSIPVYQQVKPTEYNYRESYNRNFTAREAETLANCIGEKAFAHPKTETAVILKTEFIKKDGDVDEVRALAHSYRTVGRVDYVAKLGGDGRMHQVPVPWREYIPLTQLTKFEMKELDKSERQYLTSQEAHASEAHAYMHNIYATLGDVEASEDLQPDYHGDDISEFGDIEEIAEEIQDEVED